MRTEAGITQTQLADKLEMTQSAYSKLERGELRIDLVQLRTILLAIGGSLGEFVTHFETELCQSLTSSKRKPKSNGG